jgi:DNA processing protein
VSDSAYGWVGLSLARFGLPAGVARQGRFWWPAREDAVRTEIERARRLGVTLVTPEDDGFPPLLRASADPPALLYVRGRLDSQDRLAVAVVGARRATAHGVRLAERLAEDLAARGFTVVSGLARGIDAAVHRGALNGGGRTVAVLGCGIDRVYPREHARLAEAIASQGAVVSELPLGTPPLRQNFPGRNRLIAWMSWGTVVVEAARDSGSLITAGLAAEEGRLVFAVPGPPGDPNSEGTNGLLREGALCCRGVADVLEDLAPQIVETARALAAARAPAGTTAGGDGEDSGIRTGVNDAQRRILDALPPTRAIDAEALGAACGLEPGRLLSELLELELRGLVKALPGRRYLRCL